MARRFAGEIKPLRGRGYPSILAFVDVETYIHEDTDGRVSFPFRLGVLIFVEIRSDGKVHRRSVNRFSSPNEFISLLLDYISAKKVLHLFGHNIGFDLRALDVFNKLHSAGFTVSLPIINHRVFIARATSDRGSILMLDTANYGAISVEQMGRDVSLPKLEVSFETADDETLYVYCERDAEILERFMLSYIAFLKKNDLGGFSVTLASQAMSAFRHRFMPVPPVLHNFDGVLKLERSGYRGGRVECFYIGQLNTQKYYYLDINSMYPTVMLNNEYPYQFAGFTENLPLRWLGARLARFYCIADVTLKTQTNAYPRYYNDALCFPTGQYRTVLHDAELRFAYERGEIVTVHSCASYYKARLFTDYVMFFNELKEQAAKAGNVSWRLIAKLMLNSLYGKFGQLDVTREIIGETEQDAMSRMTVIDYDTGQHFIEYEWFGEKIREVRGGEAALSFPAIAGAVTAYARMMLFGYIQKAKMDNVFYCDTDSLFTNEAGYELLSDDIDSYKLGMLKLEDVATHVEIYNPKDYIFGDKVRHKGIPSKAERVGPQKWRYLQFTSFLSWLNDGASGPPLARYIERERKSAYRKGNVSSEGRVTPFVLSLLEQEPQRVRELHTAF